MKNKLPNVVVSFKTKKLFISFFRETLEDLIKTLEANPDATSLGLEIIFEEVILSEDKSEMMLG